MKLSLLTTLTLLSASISATAINNAASGPAGGLVGRAPVVSANDGFCHTVTCSNDTPCETAKCGKCDTKQGLCKGDGVPKGTCHNRICNFPYECEAACTTCGANGYCV
ncbi:hypothetical protein TI39_contig369g00005 [Zymoseptoria brevis]|uniref:Uncharacterized protein n=1 Tax=Zymoseptoria brevis TaxID=1047168 RepID=A0A0F4GPM4_9PEZI|nr:hypothetical protein TI39_contig369g00005 [Zymoseptoria brevis]